MSTALASDPMGLKRICTSCSARFFDMNKRPIICPTCGTEFTGEIKVKGRRGRAAAEVEEVKEVETKKKETSEDEIDLLEDDPEVEVVSLEDADVKTKDDTNNDDDDVVDEDDTLKDIPDFDEDIDESLGGGEDVLLDDDED